MSSSEDRVCRTCKVSWNPGETLEAKQCRLRQLELSITMPQVVQVQAPPVEPTRQTSTLYDTALAAGHRVCHTAFLNLHTQHDRVLCGAALYVKHPAMPPLLM